MGKLNKKRTQNYAHHKQFFVDCFTMYTMLSLVNIKYTFWEGAMYFFK